MKIYAHRCRGFGFPEHSIRAIRAALQSPVDGIEIDLRLTKDKKWVAVHDPFHKNDEQQTLRIHEHTLSRLKREVIPLDSVLALFAALGKGKELMIDIKDVGETRQLLRLLKRHGVLHRTLAIAWEPEILKRLHKEDSQVRLGLSFVHIPARLRGVKLSMKRPKTDEQVLVNVNRPHSFDERFPIGRTHEHYLSELPDLPLESIQVFSLTCSTGVVQQGHKRGTRVVAFTVNNRLNATLLKKRGVDAILTDEPSLFLK